MILHHKFLNNHLKNRVGDANMAGSDKYKLPTDYKLGAVAEKVALNLHLRLNEEDNDTL